MFDLFLTPAYVPFTIAFVVMLGIGLIEAIGLGVGHLDLHGGIEAGADGDIHGGGLLDWLGLGELPILIWLTSLLACFTVIGIAVQQTASAMIGGPVPATAAAGGAFVGALLLNTVVANGLARIMPGFETTAISSDELVRLRRTVLEGVARRGQPARAKIVDRFGQAHYVMIEPHEDAGSIAQGETALLVRREGSIFFGLPDVNALRAI